LDEVLPSSQLEETDCGNNLIVGKHNCFGRSSLSCAL